MEKEMEEVFERKVREKQRKLTDTESDLKQKLSEAQEKLDKQKEELDDKIAHFEKVRNDWRCPDELIFFLRQYAAGQH